jgi:hypothetical protein
MMLNASRRPVMAGAMFLLLAACGDAATSPEESRQLGGTPSVGQAPAGGSGDTVHTATPAPAPSPPGDTARTTPPAPAPATSIALAVYVGIASPGADTLRSTPAANARVSVSSRTFARGTGTGPDTLIVTETLVASATTDAAGKVSFSDLPATGYRIEAVTDGGRGAIQIAPPYASTVATSIIIRPAP